MRTQPGCAQAPVRSKCRNATVQPNAIATIQPILRVQAIGHHLKVGRINVQQECRNASTSAVPHLQLPAGTPHVHDMRAKSPQLARKPPQ